MPRKAKESGPGVGHNSGTVHTAAERKAIINEALSRITSLDAEKKALGDDISSIKNELIKGKLGMKVADFNAALRLYKLGGDERDDFLGTLQETFDAMGIGDQLDWVSINERKNKTVTDSEDGQAGAAAQGPVQQAAE